jgi:16S rRNA processing protein RimM
VTEVVLGDLVKPIGLQGDVKLREAPDFWEAALASTKLQLVHGDRRVAVHVRQARALGRGMYRLSFVEITDRNGSEEVVGGRLVVALPDDGIDPPPQLRPFQVIGCRVELMDGTRIGQVADVQELPGQTLLVVQGEQRQHLVPNVPAIVRRIDQEARLVRIDPPSGLLEL